jgi:hypothetical protein
VAYGLLTISLAEEIRASGPPPGALARVTWTAALEASDRRVPTENAALALRTVTNEVRQIAYFAGMLRSKMAQAELEALGIWTAADDFIKWTLRLYIIDRPCP